MSVQKMIRNILNFWRWNRWVESFEISDDGGTITLRLTPGAVLTPDGVLAFEKKPTA